MTRVVAVMVATLVLASAGHAQAGGAERAEEAFQQGKSLLAEKRYAEACSKFEESQRADPASGTMLALAYCQELAGLLATAWQSYLRAEQIAVSEGQPDRRTAAQDRSKALAERLSTLTIVIPSELTTAPALQITRDGLALGREQFGTALPVDGGAHRIQVTADGRVPWTETVIVRGERDQKTLIVPVLALNPPPATPAPTPVASPAPVLPPAGAPAPDESRSTASGLEKASLVLAVGSLVGLGIGTAFGLDARSKNEASNADGHCDQSGCDERGTQLRNDALDAARVSTWCFVAGGVLAVGSVALYLGAKSSEPAAKVRVGWSGGLPHLEVARDF